MEDPGQRDVNIIRIKNGFATEEKDQVVVEMPLTIFLNDHEFVTLLCSPFSLEYLAVGFLRSEGLISAPGDLQEVSLDKENGFVYVKTTGSVNLEEKLYGKRTITSGCGKGTVFFNVLDSLQSKPIVSDLQIKSEKLLALMKQLQANADLFKATGGVHIAALADPDGILFSSEDIGRHNAVDKIVGRCIMDDIPMNDKILLTSGRLSSEIVIKGAKMGFPFLVSRSAPTTLSIELAVRLGITLVGFVRGSRLNIYAHADRIAEGLA